jgi:hypothetical protein
MIMLIQQAQSSRVPDDVELGDQAGGDISHSSLYLAEADEFPQLLPVSSSPTIP